jgi:hypothetical protein
MQMIPDPYPLRVILFDFVGVLLFARAGAQKAGMQAIHWENREAGFQHFLEFMRK